MRIACVQFAPQTGDVDNNLNRADAVLSRANQADLDDLDLLVLPELAFTGTDFKSLEEITPFLEPAGSGISALWARTTALKYNCNVVIGYPEKVDVAPNLPGSPKYYNSSIIVNGDGETIANYRKRALFPGDKKWALEGKAGFYSRYIDDIGHTAMGISSDILACKPGNPSSQHEFALHVAQVKADVAIVTMAWEATEERRKFSRQPMVPDMDTLTCWVQQLQPLIQAESSREVIVIFCNRTGSEGGGIFSGTSAVLGIKSGEVVVYGLLGRGVKETLVVDTDNAPFAKLVKNPTDERSETRSKRSLVHERKLSGSLASQLSPGLPPPTFTSFDVPRVAPPTKSRTKSPIAPPPTDARAKSPVSVSVTNPSPISPANQSPVSGSQRTKHKPQSPKLLIPKSQFQSLSHITSPSSGSPNVDTPTCPSPTPAHMRPQLCITTTVSTPYPGRQTKRPFVFGGSVTVTTDIRSPLSPTTPFLEFYRNTSPSSPHSPGLFQCSPVQSPTFHHHNPSAPSGESQLYWMPPRQLLKSPVEKIQTPQIDSPLQRMLSLFAMGLVGGMAAPTPPPDTDRIIEEVETPKPKSPASGHARHKRTASAKSLHSAPSPKDVPLPRSRNATPSPRDSKPQSRNLTPSPRAPSSRSRSSSLAPKDHSVKQHSKSASPKASSPTSSRGPTPPPKDSPRLYESDSWPLPGPDKVAASDHMSRTHTPHAIQRPSTAQSLTGNSDARMRMVASIPIAASPSIFKKDSVTPDGRELPASRPTSRRGHHTQMESRSQIRSRSLTGEKKDRQTFDPLRHIRFTPGDPIPRPQTSLGLRDRQLQSRSPVPPADIDADLRPRGRSTEQRGTSKHRKREDTPGSSSQVRRREQEPAEPAGPDELDLSELDPDEIIATICKITPDCPHHAQIRNPDGTYNAPIIQDSDGSLYTVSLPAREQALPESLRDKQVPPETVLQNQASPPGGDLGNNNSNNDNRRQTAVW